MVAIDSSAFGTSSRASTGTTWPADVAVAGPQVLVGRHRADAKAVLTWRRMMYTARHRG